MAKARSSIPSAASKLLIVDDDAFQLRALTRAVSGCRRDISILTAGSVPEAIELLAKSPVDVVLSDLQMPDMDGFELVAWMIKHTPQIAVFAMTAYWNRLAEEKLARLGGIECFTKPLDVSAVVARIDEVLAGGFRGQIHNMSAASLLQIISMDRKTCTLIMTTPQRSGRLYIQKGEVVDARSDELRGERAALSMLSWSCPTITIDSHCRVAQRTIDTPLTFLIMEALRLADEEARVEGAGSASSSENPASRKPSSTRDAASHQRSVTPVPGSGALPKATPTPDPATAYISQFPLAAMKALGLALVHTQGRILAFAAEASVELPAMARLAGTLLVEVRTAQERLATGQSVDELVLIASGLCYLIKPLASRSDAFTLLVFNPRDTSLAIRRTDMDELVRRLDTNWAPNAAPVP